MSKSKQRSKGSRKVDVKYVQVAYPIANIIAYPFGGAEFISITTKEHYTDVDKLQLIIDKLLGVLESKTEVKLQTDNNNTTAICKCERFIPLYVHECDADITCGVSYRAYVNKKYTIKYAYFESLSGEIVVDYTILKDKNSKLTEDEVKFAAYLFAYTHYCMGNKYGENIHYSVGFGYNRLSDIGYVIPLGYIYKVNVPFIDMDEFERLIETLQVRFESGWEKA